MRIFFVGCGVALLACASGGLNVQATVTSARTSCETEAEASAGQRLPGSTISLSCPHEPGPPETQVIGITDRAGVLSVNETAMDRGIQDDCEIIVQASRHRARRYRVGEVCTQYTGHRCVQVRINAEVVSDRVCP